MTDIQTDMQLLALGAIFGPLIYFAWHRVLNKKWPLPLRWLLLAIVAGGSISIVLAWTAVGAAWLLAQVTA